MALIDLASPDRTIKPLKELYNSMQIYKGLSKSI